MAATRRLAAILAADVAGYSRLMGADEEGTLERLKALRRELLDPKIAEHHGRVVKTTSAGAAAPRQAFDRGIALRQYERRSRAGVFRRRYGRGDHRCALPHPLALRHRPQFEFYVQGPSDRREAGRARIRRAVCPRRIG